MIRYCCDKCYKEIKDLNKESKTYSVMWGTNCTQSSVKILLCNECSKEFHNKILHCSWD